jgi:hypothetical protein
MFSGEDITDLLSVKLRTISSFALNPTLVKAINDQNAQHLSIETVKKRDEEWKTDKTLTPFKYALQSNTAGRFLKAHVEGNSAFSEAFLTDNQGANVAAYPPTSDYWQGDEEKWTASFNGGEGTLFIGPLEKDESTNTEAVQVSAPVLDFDGSTIGVLIVGVNLSYLQSKANKVPTKVDSK